MKMKPTKDIIDCQWKVRGKWSEDGGQWKTVDPDDLRGTCLAMSVQRKVGSNQGRRSSCTALGGSQVGVEAEAGRGCGAGACCSEN